MGFLVPLREQLLPTRNERLQAAGLGKYWYLHDYTEGEVSYYER
jgi:hypothetical protein